MARFWILLLIVWYKACSVAHTEVIQQSNDQITSQNTNPEDQKVSEDKEDVYYMEKPMIFNKAKMPIELMRHIMPMFPRESYKFKQRSEFPNDLELSNSLIDDFVNEKRGFRSWGGKREAFKEKREETTLPELAKTFYSWRGRRSMDPDYVATLYNLPELSEANYALKRDSRRPFYSDNWGGWKQYK